MTTPFENVTEVGVALTGQVVGVSFIGSGSVGSRGELPEPSQFAYYVQIEESQEIEIVRNNPLILRIPGDCLSQLDLPMDRD